MGLLRRVREARDKEEGEGLFSALCRVVEGENATWAEKLRAKANKYLAFLGYPEEVRKHIYTTNPVESVNAGISSGGWSWEGISPRSGPWR